ncbi:cytochrome P450 2U1-like isoform X2 [Amphiura filiformis]|uniref:cytochrome P450 2U1-like isoform X2 n=1 Tax=Amphiura filiformis TaxID=82378 RepID=UPI003B227458
MDSLTAFLWERLGIFSPNTTTILIFLACLFMLRYLLQYAYRANPKHPPGPRPWPVIGNLLQIIGTDPHKKLAKMAALYGGILMVHLGPVRTLILSDLDVVKHAMVRQADCFSDREQPKLLEEAFQSEGSVLWENGTVWKEHRRMVHNAFRHLGFRQKQFHTAITKEINALCECLEAKAQTTFDLRNLMTSATANVICTICFGQRYDYGDTEFSNAISSMLKISETISGISVVHLIPKLYHTPLYNKLRRNVNTLSGFIQKNVHKHRSSFDPSNIRDVIDVYLSNELPDQPDIIWRGLFDLFTAGSETTADSLLWAILYLIIHPDIQEKVQKELDSITVDEIFQYPQSTRLLPFTYATLMEVHRHQSVAPLSVPRVTRVDTTLLGYDIPKGTGVWDRGSV